MLPCLTLSIIKKGSRVKWSNPGKWVAPSPTPWCSSYWKGGVRVALDYSRLLLITILSKWLNSFILPINGTLKITTNPGQSGPRGNGNKELLRFLKVTRLKPNHLMQFNVIPRTLVAEESLMTAFGSDSFVFQTDSSSTATYHPSRKLSMLDEPDMQDTAGEEETNSKVIYSCGPLHMDEQRQDDQLEPIYNSRMSSWRPAGSDGR